MNRLVQVMLDPEERRRAQRRAAELGVSLPEYIRRLVRADLETLTPADQPIAVLAIEDSGEPMSPRRDVYIGEAVAERFARSDR